MRAATVPPLPAPASRVGRSATPVLEIGQALLRRQTTGDAIRGDGQEVARVDRQDADCMQRPPGLLKRDRKAAASGIETEDPHVPWKLRLHQWLMRGEVPYSERSMLA